MKNKNNEIFVLNTFPLIVIDYNYEKAMEILHMKLKDNFLKIDWKIDLYILSLFFFV